MIKKNTLSLWIIPLVPWCGRTEPWKSLMISSGSFCKGLLFQPISQIVFSHFVDLENFISGCKLTPGVYEEHQTTLLRCNIDTEKLPKPNREVVFQPSFFRGVHHQKPIHTNHDLRHQCRALKELFTFLFVAEKLRLLCKKASSAVHGSQQNIFGFQIR